MILINSFRDNSSPEIRRQTLCGSLTASSFKNTLHQGGSKSMEMRKQGEGQGTARSASKSASKKPQGEQGTASDQSTSPHQGTSQGIGSTPGTPATQGDQDLLQHAKQASGQIVHQVQERAGSQLNQQKETAAQQLSQVANAVRRLRENLGGAESGAIARYAADYGDKAADSLERLGNYIREQDPRQLLDDVQNFGRRRPALMLGGAFLLGFAGARLIKSAMDTGSQHQSYRTNMRTPSYTGANVSGPRSSTTPSAL